MQVYRLAPGAHLDGLTRSEEAPRALGPGEVRVRVRAVALNYRDLMIARGSYPLGSDRPLIPCSDGAGEIIECAPGAGRFSVGDRVVSSFFPRWIGGLPAPETLADSLGGTVDGMLAEETVLHETALIRAPDGLDFAEAATLSCAGVTAWNALFETAALRPADTVLLLGTGGVSIWALQLAVATGLRAIVTSSSDAKLARAEALGAQGLINYRRTPEWQQEVLRLTAGRGVDAVLEVGGRDTVLRSMAALRMRGTAVIIGGVSGLGGEFAPRSLVAVAQRMAGVFVGSRTMLEDLSRFVGITQLHPVIDRRFGFEQAREAYAFLESGQHFGKVVLEF